MIEPRWITLARSLIGLKEIKGSKHNEKIVQMWKDIKRGGIKDDESPWCSALVGSVLENSGIVSSRYESALSYLKWGIEIPNPAMGCIVVFRRDGGGGHVGFAVGEDASGRLLILGGNQSDSVSISAFLKARVVGYRWPTGEPLTGELPKFASATVALSKSEA